MRRRLIPFVLLIPSLSSGQTLQRAVDAAMQGHLGGVVLLSVESGKVLSSYRPQVVAQRVTLPGSVIKPFILLELLRTGKVSASTELSCRRKVQIGGRKLDCQHVRTVEAMNAERALAYSCNFYFTEMGARLTEEELMTGLRRAGFGNPTHLMPAEASGAFRPAATRALLQLKAVGEEGVGVTPLQMAAAYRRLAQQSATAELETVKAGLRAAVQYGTAQGAKVEGLEVAGKTGTSTAEEGRWTHAWFAGFAPANKPEVVVVVFLERGHGSEAGGIAGEVLKAWARGAR